MLVEMMRNHVAYDWWASSRLLDAADGLSAEQLERDFGTADKGIKGTMVHVFRGARVWLARVKPGTAPLTFALPEDEDWPSLRGKWTQVHDEWTRLIEAVTEQDLEKNIEFSDLKGRPWSQPLWQVVLHLVNHGTHHRGQVSGFLRSSGAVPPALDFIAYMRLKQRK